MQEDFADLQRSAAWLERGYILIQSSRSVWPLMAGIAGLLANRKSGGVLTKAARMFSWWTLAKKMGPLLRSFQADRP